MHVTVGIFGTPERCHAIAASLAKKGTENDIAIYNHGSSEGVYTYVCLNTEPGKPQKVQPLLQALAMVDFPVLAVGGLTKDVGEAIVAVDEMRFAQGFIVADAATADALKPMIKGTSLEKFEFVGEDALKEKISGTRIERDDAGPAAVPVDNYFNVKGVGTVVLGVVKSGKLKLHDKLVVEPAGTEVSVKGIQSQDKDLEESAAGMRIGLNLKGIEADDLKRGYVVCAPGAMQKSAELKIKFAQSRFSKQEVKQGTRVMLAAGLQIVSCVITSFADGELALKADSSVAYTKAQRFIIASQNETMPRIIGSGTIA
ncbi:MAG: EF-Tu/IF-2/RF-3 family GTPase [Candidatus Aenigmarchaeota archaeon]|nr:EF-Tu/IF-2/RF-3 family GTPase [Candidatus Aenigmarchaeota archaeon]